MGQPIIIPNTNVAGQILASVGDGQSTSQWVAGNNGLIQFTKSYAVLGPLIAYTFPGFSMSVPSGQVVNLVAVITQLSAGTATVQVTQNGTGIGGLTALSVTTSSSGYVHPTINPTPVADLDRFAFVVLSPASTGDIVIDYVFTILP